ncbi:hypothetical protein [Pseudomonas putida]|jgi:hypothetical protein|nr:hypothetical protein [Pseudomonas putida]
MSATLPRLVAGIAFLGAALGFTIAQMFMCTIAGALSFGVWG